MTIHLRGETQIKIFILNVDLMSKSWPPPSPPQPRYQCIFLTKQRSTFSQISGSYCQLTPKFYFVYWQHFFPVIHITCMILLTVATDSRRPRPENFFPSVVFLFNENRESVVKKKSRSAGRGLAKTSSNLYFHHIYIYIKTTRQLGLVATKSLLLTDKLL